MIKLKDILKEELSKGEKFGIKEAATHIASLHKQLNAALFRKYLEQSFFKFTFLYKLCLITCFST